LIIIIKKTYSGLSLIVLTKHVVLERLAKYRIFLLCHNDRGRMSCKEMSQVKHIGFLTLNNFSMIAFSNAIEILRMANYLLGQEAY